MAIIGSICSSIIIAVIGYLLNKKFERERDWQKDKINHYKMLISNCSEFTINPENKEARDRFLLAKNTVALIASQSVITALEEHINTNGDNLKELLLEIRKDIGRSKKDNPKTFEFSFTK